ncbi:MAG: DNA-binding CsgD family transcriptional regulator [Candidatus Poriferisodalaceae bacterium]|jgi:DNA-binding CsgD family transcriptional regulator
MSRDIKMVGLIGQLSNRDKPNESDKLPPPCSSELPFTGVEIPETDGHSTLRDDEIDLLVVRYDNGESTGQLAVALGINRNTVSHHLERRGIPRRGFTRSLTDDQCVEIAKLYVSGLSLTQIGNQYAVHAKTVSNELRKLDVEIRPQGKSHR